MCRLHVFQFHSSIRCCCLLDILHSSAGRSVRIPKWCVRCTRGCGTRASFSFLASHVDFGRRFTTYGLCTYRIRFNIYILLHGTPLGRRYPPLHSVGCVFAFWCTLMMAGWLHHMCQLFIVIIIAPSSETNPLECGAISSCSGVSV